MISLDKINNLIFELNLMADYNHSFTLTTDGNDDFILFNNVCLWHSDEHGYMDDIESLENFVKKEFNKYLDTLKLCRFKTSHKEEKSEDGVFEAVDEIFINLNDRSLAIDTLDEDLQQEIFDEMVNSIRKYV